MAFDPFEDAPAIELGDWGEAATVPTGVRHVIVVPRPRHVAATAIQIDGRLTPGGTVRLRATAGESFQLKRSSDGEESVADATIRSASAAELQLCCWRVHCGGRMLVDQLPRQDPGGAARSNSISVQLPAVLTGETLVAVAYTWRPRVDWHQQWWIEDQRGARRDGRAGTLQSDRQLAEIMNALPQHSSPAQPVPARMARFYEVLTRLFPTYEMSGTLQQTHFLAQIKHESIGMTALRERISPEVAGRKYAHTNGNQGEEDGRTFIGRGLMQLTGFNNYWAFFASLPGASPPTRGDRESVQAYARRQREWLYRLAPQVETDENLAVRTAFEHWQRKRVHRRAAVDDVLGVSIRVNGWNRGSYLPNHYDTRVRPEFNRSSQQCQGERIVAPRRVPRPACASLTSSGAGC